MKQKIIIVAITIGIVILGILWINSDLLAQDNNDAEQPDEKNIPFIDRDGDGINDFLQHGWGLKILERHKQRQK